MKSLQEIYKVIKNKLTSKKSLKFYTHFYGLVAIIGLVFAIVGLYYAYESIKLYKEYGKTTKVEINQNILTLYDEIGKTRNVKFESNIAMYHLFDIDKDSLDEIIIGFDKYGKNNNQIVVLKNDGDEFFPPFTYPYAEDSPYCPKGEFLATRDIKGFNENGEGRIAVLMGDFTWYQSVFFILSEKGELLKRYWHPGQLHKIFNIKEKFIITGVNNKLRDYLNCDSILKNQNLCNSVLNNTRLCNEISVDSNYRDSIIRDILKRNENYCNSIYCDSVLRKFLNFKKSNYPHIIFCIDYENIFGAFPYGVESINYNNKLNWYYYIKPIGASIADLTVMNDSIFLWVNSKRWTLDTSGKELYVSKGDYYNELTAPHFVRLNY